MKINYVWQVSPAGYIHSHAFDEIVRSMSDALQALGHPAKIVYEHPPREGALVFGAHLAQRLLPPEFIIFNTEQITDDSNWMKSGYAHIMRNHQIWDYSTVNAEELRKRGLHVQHCEIGYMPSMTNIEPAQFHDIDVLFIGSPNARRDLLMKQLSKPFHTVYRDGVYGKERDDLIARAKIVLNLHYYDSAIFEIVRCAHLMANKKCIVSEWGKDKAIEQKYYGAIKFVDYAEIPDACAELLKNDDLRKSWEICAFEGFASRSQIDILRPILERMMP